MIQSTIKKKIVISGHGIHSGDSVNLEILPSSIDSGILFDVNNVKIKANYSRLW